MRKILFVTYDIPYPANSGGKTRAYNLIKFAGKGCEVLLFSFVRKTPTDHQIKKLEKIGVKKCFTETRRGKKNIKSMLGVVGKNSIFKNLYYDTKTEEKIIEIIKNEGIDVVHFESYYTGFYIGKKLDSLGVKQIFGTENIENKLYELYTKQSAPFLTRPILMREVRKIKNEECSMIKSADHVLAVTKSENKYVKDHGAKKSTIIENGVDIKFFDEVQKNEKKKKYDALFIANFAYFPNIDAINYFYSEILDLLTEDTKILVVGQKHETLGIDDNRLHFSDYIEDIREAYAKAKIMISPIRIGGGTNFKILEAMAAGTPVVADPARIEDLGAKKDVEIVTAGDAKGFAKNITMLLDDQTLRENISRNARAFVEKNYSWDNIGKRLNNIWRQI